MIGVELVAAGALCSLVALLSSSSWSRLPAARNHRGRPVPVVLGLVIMIAAAFAVSIVASERALRGSRAVVTGRVVAVSVAVALVFTAGLLDDLVRGGPRGLRGHLRALLDGRLTTGLAKVLAALAAGIVVAMALPHRGIAARAAGVVVMAGAANLWNGLDVAPGRAAKAFVLTGAGVLAAGPSFAAGVPLLSIYGATLAVAWADLRERAMLGDGGANVLGFAVGAGLFSVLPGWGVVLAAALVVALNVAAETVTLSRIIDVTPPLRWLDRAGRPHEEDEKFARNG